jgi:hydroxypyruvate reductase
VVRSQAHALTRSLHALRHDLDAIVRAGIRAVDADRLVTRAASAEAIAAPGLRVIAAGKAARPMAKAAVHLFAGRIRTGIIVSVEPVDTVGPPFMTIIGGHPTPTPESERAGRRALELAASLGHDETLLVLLSGGASSLMAVPAEGLTLDDKRAATSHLLRAGADIHALNTVRKHLSAIKGGWLAARTRGACRTFAISDVVGDDLTIIGSGPTVADTSTFADALDVVRRFGGEAAYPPAVVARLRRGAAGADDVPETPKPGDPRLSRAVTTLVGGRRDAMAGAGREAESRGYHVVQIDRAIIGEARGAGPAHLAAVFATVHDAPRPTCVVSSGETTVRVVGDGRGGRNQEFVLAAAGFLDARGVPAAAASVGTDGIDGPTDAAGALIDSATAARARAAGLDLQSFLDHNNAYVFFDALGDLIRTGPTDTNVGDLQVVLLA